MTPETVEAFALVMRRQGIQRLTAEWSEPEMGTTEPFVIELHPSVFHVESPAAEAHPVKLAKQIPDSELLFASSLPVTQLERDAEKL